MGEYTIAKALEDIAGHQKTRIDLSNCELTEQDVAHLCDALKDNDKILSLSLSGNNVGPSGCLLICEMLKCNRRLKSLDLNVNCIGDEGALYLSQALRENTTLTELMLYGNGITVVGDHHLLYALQHNTSITFLDLQYDPHASDSAMQRSIQERVKNNVPPSPARQPEKTITSPKSSDSAREPLPALEVPPVDKGASPPGTPLQTSDSTAQLLNVMNDLVQAMASGDLPTSSPPGSPLAPPSPLQYMAALVDHAQATGGWASPQAVSPLTLTPKDASSVSALDLSQTAAEMSMKSDSTLLSKSRSPSFPRIKAVADQIQNASAPAVTAVAATTTKEVKQRPAPLPIIDAPMLPDSLIIEPLNQEANAHAVGTPPTEVSTAAAPAEEEVKPKPAALPILPDSLIAQPQIQEPRADVGTAAGMAAKPNPVILPDPDANMALRTSLLPPSNNEQRADVGLATRTLTRQSSNTSGCSNVSIGVDEYLASRPADLYLSPSSALRALDTSQSPYSGRKASAPASGNATPPNVISQKRHQSISSGSPLSIAVPSPSQRSNSIGSTPYQAPPSPLSPLLQSQWYQPYYTTAYYPSTPMTSYQVPSTTTAYRYYPASYVEPGGIPSIPTMYSSSVPLEQYRSSQFATIAFPSHGVPMQCSPPSSGTPSPANRTSSDPSPRLAPASWVSYGTRITHSS